MIKSLLLVFFGGGAGSVLRYAIGRGAAALAPGAFPWGTLTVNIVGSLAAGLLIGWLSSRAGPPGGTPHLLVMVGFLGGFTTFSAFSIEAVFLLGRQPTMAVMYVGATLLMSLASAALGLWLMRLN